MIRRAGVTVHRWAQCQRTAGGGVFFVRSFRFRRRLLLLLLMWRASESNSMKLNERKLHYIQINEWMNESTSGVQVWCRCLSLSVSVAHSQCERGYRRMRTNLWRTHFHRIDTATHAHTHTSNTELDDLAPKCPTVCKTCNIHASTAHTGSWSSQVIKTIEGQSIAYFWNQQHQHRNELMNDNSKITKKN